MIDFSNMLGKPLRHCFVPADQASITFVFEDGMRRSFGVVNSGGTRLTPCEVQSPSPTEGVIFIEVRPATLDGTSYSATYFVTRENGIIFSYPAGGELIELPE
jgi:hypothetical protein